MNIKIQANRAAFTEARRAHALPTVRAVADFLGMSPDNIGRMLEGRRDASAPFIARSVTLFDRDDLFTVVRVP